MYEPALALARDPESPPFAMSPSESTSLSTGLDIAMWQLSTANELYKEDSRPLAKIVAQRAFASVNNSLRVYATSAEYQAWAAWERQILGGASDGEEPPTIVERAVRLRFEICADALAKCDAVPSLIVEDTCECLRDVVNEGAGSIARLIALCDAAEHIVREDARQC
jgi:hypothetical protein